MTLLIQQTVTGLAVGCIYALVALGFVLLYKATGAINFAHGELMVLGAFAIYVGMVSLKLPGWVAIPLAVLALAGVGLVVERLVARPLIHSGIFTVVMATLGVAVIIRGVLAAFLVAQGAGDALPFPKIFPDQAVRVGDITVAPVYLWTIAIAVVLILAFSLFFKYTAWGVAMRATAQDRVVARLMGTRVGQVYALSWALSAMLAAVAGLLLAPVTFLSIDMGTIGLKAIPAAILGGFGSIPGAILGGVIIGLAEGYAGIYLPEGFRNVFAYVVLLVVLMIRPTGLFGLPERKRV